MESKKPKGKGLNLQKLRSIYLRRRQVIWLLFFSSAIVVVLVAYVQSEAYEARAQILVRVGVESLSTSSVVLPEMGFGESADHMSSQIQIMSSETLLRGVVERLGVDRILAMSPPHGGLKSTIGRGFNDAAEGMRGLLDRLGLLRRQSPTERAVRRIESQLKITPVENSSIVQVSIRWADPAMAAQIVNTLAEQYIHYAMKVQEPKGGFEFVSEQVDKMKQDMDKANEQLTAFKRARAITNLPDQQRLLFEQLSDRRAELQDIDSGIAELEGSIRAIDKQLASLPKEVKHGQTEHKNPVYESLRLRESDLEVELADARTKYTEESGVVQTLLKQINVIRERLQSEETLRLSDVSVGENSTYKLLETDKEENLVFLTGFQTKKNVVQDHIRSIMEKLAALNAAETELAHLEIEDNIASKNYEVVRDKFETARISKIMNLKDLASYQLLEPASIPVRPDRSRLLILTLGLMGSLLIAVAGAFVSEHFDHSLKDPSEVRDHLQLPTLSMHPQRLGLPAASQSHATLALDRPGQNLLEFREPIKDVYQHIRSRLLLSSLEGDQGKTIMVATSVPHEGGTTVALNLAISLADSHGSCLLIDGNLRDPAIHALNGLERKPGLTDLLGGSTEAMSLVKPTPFPYLSMVTSGEDYVDPLELYVSSLWKDALKAWQAHFRWIVIDTAPIQPCAEGTLLASQVDEVILVVGAGTTAREVVIDTKQRLEASAGKVLGVVLNRYPKTS